MSCIFSHNRDIFFTKLSEDLHLITFAENAIKYLNQRGIKAYLCKAEEEARNFFKEENRKGRSLSVVTEHGRSGVEEWRFLFTTIDTTGEKDFEEFFTYKEVLDMNGFH